MRQMPEDSSGAPRAPAPRPASDEKRAPDAGRDYFLAVPDDPAEELDAAERDITERGHLSPLERLWLNFRYFCNRVRAHFHEMRGGELNLDWVTEYLAVGGAFSGQDVRRLRAMGVTAVVDLRGEESDDAALLAEHGIEFLHLPTPDTHPPSPEDFDRGVNWVLDQQDAGRHVLVH
jgi:hypothetical protein